MALAMLGSLLFVILGAAMILDANLWPVMKFLGWAAIAFFGLCFVLALRETVSPRVGLRLDAEGIHSRQVLMGNGFDLPWSELAGVRVVSMNGQAMVVFDAATPGWGMSGASPTVARLRNANAAMLDSWIVVAPSVFGARVDTVVDEIDRYYRHYTPDAPVVYPRPGVV